MGYKESNIHINSALRVILALGFFFSSAAVLCAEGPEAARVITPVYKPNFSEFKPPLGEYEYKVSWQGIPAAKVSINVDRKGMFYDLSTAVRTNSAIDIFYKLRYKASSEISVIDFMPRVSHYESKENSRHQKADLTFTPQGEITSVYKKNDREPKKVSFNPQNNTLDPFSAAFVARSLSWKVGQTRMFDTYNGKSRYVIYLTAKDEKEITVNGEKRRVWLISPTVQKVNAKQSKKLREATIYISADDKREILQIDSEVFIGTVKTKLTGFTPSMNGIPGTNVAQVRQKSKKVFVE